MLGSCGRHGVAECPWEPLGCEPGVSWVSAERRVGNTGRPVVENISSGIPGRYLRCLGGLGTFLILPDVMEWSGAVQRPPGVIFLIWDLSMVFPIESVTL